MLGAILPSAGKGISADAEVTVGKKEESVNTDVQVGDNSTQSAGQIQNFNEGMPWWQFLAFGLLAGWAIPDPQTMGRGVISFIRALLPFGGNR